ncbi:unnamed protein product, partial [Polarella glacialis]
VLVGASMPEPQLDFSVAFTSSPTAAFVPTEETQCAQLFLRQRGAAGVQSGFLLCGPACGGKTATALAILRNNNYNSSNSSNNKNSSSNKKNNNSSNNKSSNSNSNSVELLRCARSASSGELCCFLSAPMLGFA